MNSEQNYSLRFTKFIAFAISVNTCVSAYYGEGFQTRHFKRKNSPFRHRKQPV